MDCQQLYASRLQDLAALEGLYSDVVWQFKGPPLPLPSENPDLILT